MKQAFEVWRFNFPEPKGVHPVVPVKKTTPQGRIENWQLQILNFQFAIRLSRKSPNKAPHGRLAAPPRHRHQPPSPERLNRPHEIARGIA
jgi:hypothetical protein